MNLIKNVIEQLESATKGSRQLDGLIWQVLGNPVPRQPNWPDVVPSLHYTTNIEDALTLFDSQVGLVINIIPDLAIMVEVVFHEPIQVVGATVALAICIASMKAREE